MPEPIGAGSRRSPTVAGNGFELKGEQFPVTLSSSWRTGPRRIAGPGSFDADRRRFAELDLDAVVVRERRLDDFLLHFAVERDEDLLPDIVLPQVDQRVLLGELIERDAQRALVGGAAGTTTVSSVGGAN